MKLPIKEYWYLYLAILLLIGFVIFFFYVIVGDFTPAEEVRVISLKHDVLLD